MVTSVTLKMRARSTTLADPSSLISSNIFSRRWLGIIVLAFMFLKPAFIEREITAAKVKEKNSKKSKGIHFYFFSQLEVCFSKKAQFKGYFGSVWVK